MAGPSSSSPSLLRAAHRLLFLSPRSTTTYSHTLHFPPSNKAYDPGHTPAYLSSESSAPTESSELAVQRHVDTRRLFVWTEYFARVQSGGRLDRPRIDMPREDELAEIQAEALRLTHEQRRARVEASVRAQALTKMVHLQASLVAAGDERRAERTAISLYHRHLARHAKDRQHQEVAAAQQSGTKRQSGDKALKMTTTMTTTSTRIGDPTISLTATDPSLSTMSCSLEQHHKRQRQEEEQEEDENEEEQQPPITTTQKPPNHPYRTSPSHESDTPPMNLSAYSWGQTFLARVGAAAIVSPSSIPHAEARNGLFWSPHGHRPCVPGELITFYPGAVYRPATHRYLPGYPLVSHGNPYLILRSDHCLVDGRVWGFGEGRALPYAPVVRPPWITRRAQGVRDGSYIRAVAEGHDWRGVDLRNPTALGHFANHPPPGHRPNVLKVAVDFEVEDLVGAGLRAYFPFVVVPEEVEEERGEGRGEKMVRGAGSRTTTTTTTTGSGLRLGFGVDEQLRRAEEWMDGRGEGDWEWWIGADLERKKEGMEKRGSVGPVPPRRLRVPGVALVASAFVAPGEEFFLNYRYNPRHPRPEWYHPVDADEANRLWQHRGVHPVE